MVLLMAADWNRRKNCFCISLLLAGWGQTASVADLKIVLQDGEEPRLDELLRVAGIRGGNIRGTALLWHDRQCDIILSVTCVSVWHDCQCDICASVTYVPVWHVCQCDMCASVTCVPVWHVCQCDMCASVTCVPVWHVWHVCQCDICASVTCVSVWHVCQCDMTASV